MIELMNKDLKMRNERRPRFFKVFLPNASSKRLSIPLGFVKHMKGITSGPIFLTGPSRNTWQVNMIQNKDGLFFHEGWPAFVNDHSTEYGDFFVFRYDGNLHFTVMIFDKSACEKEVAFRAKCSQSISNSGKGKGKKRVCVQEAASSYETFEAAPKRRVTKIDEQRTSEVCATSRPFFVRCMTKPNIYQPHYMYFPSSFVEKHCPNYQKKQKIVLQNSEGNQWTVNFVRLGKRRRGNGACLCGGWPSFIRDNHIKEGETCMFELVGEFKMLVHVSGRNTILQQAAS